MLKEILRLRLCGSRLRMTIFLVTLSVASLTADEGSFIVETLPLHQSGPVVRVTKLVYLKLKKGVAPQPHPHETTSAILFRIRQFSRSRNLIFRITQI